MADAFSHVDAKALLVGKRILFLGDSNIRAQYKDLVWLLNSNTLISKNALRRKLELSYLGDSLVCSGKLNHGRDYEEVRLYCDKNNQTIVEFMFLTRCYSIRLEKLFHGYKNWTKQVPDVIVIHSCLWDINRWGPNGVPQYKDNMVKLMRLMKESLPSGCLVIWTTALPPAPHVRCSILLKQIEFMEHLLRFEMMEANMFARDTVVKHGFDVLDNHYHLRMQLHRRGKDGVHYTSIPVRFMTNLILTHIALSWGENLPNNISSVLLNKAIALDGKYLKKSPPEVVKMPTGGIFSKINLQSPVVPKGRGLKITFNPQEESTVRRCKLFQDEVIPCEGIYPLSQEVVPPPRPQIRSCVSQPYPGVSQSYYGQQIQQPPPIMQNFTGPIRNKKKKRKNNKRKDPYHDNRYNYRY